MVLTLDEAVNAVRPEELAQHRALHRIRRRPDGDQLRPVRFA